VSRTWFVTSTVSVTADESPAATSPSAHVRTWPLTVAAGCAETYVRPSASVSDSTTPRAVATADRLLYTTVYAI
jgi:hypothetical protein